MITIIGIENYEKKKALSSFIKNILGVRDIVVITAGCLFKNTSIIEMVEDEVIKNGRKVVFVGANWTDCFRAIRETSLFVRNGRIVEEEAAGKVYWVKDFFSLRKIRNKI